MLNSSVAYRRMMYDSGCASTAPPALTWFDHISFTRSSPCVNARFSSARKDAKFALVARQVTEKLSSSLIALPSSSTFVRVYVALEARKIRTKLPDPSVAGGDDDQQAPDRGNSGVQGFVAGNAATPWILWCNHLALSRKNMPKQLDSASAVCYIGTEVRYS